MEPVSIAALFVMPKGPYSMVPGIDLWDESRDARWYGGPYPVVAHPPCERWGRYWYGGPSSKVRFEKGDDAGCFASALRSVRKWGGVLEHPAGSSAWKHFSLAKPPRAGGWVKADDYGFTCCVDQGHYGHRAQKATWLYAVRVRLPDLIWGKSDNGISSHMVFNSEAERRRIIRTGKCQRLSRKQRTETPEAFRDLLISIAKTVPVK